MLCTPPCSDNPYFKCIFFLWTQPRPNSSVLHRRHLLLPIENIPYYYTVNLTRVSAPACIPTSTAPSKFFFVCGTQHAFYFMHTHIDARKIRQGWHVYHVVFPHYCRRAKQANSQQNLFFCCDTPFLNGLRSSELGDKNKRKHITIKKPTTFWLRFIIAW